MPKKKTERKIEFDNDSCDLLFFKWQKLAFFLDFLKLQELISEETHSEMTDCLLHFKSVFDSEHIVVTKID